MMKLIIQEKNFGASVEERFGELADAGMVGDRGDFQLQHKQRDDDGEHPVAEGFEAVEAEMAAGEAGEEGLSRSNIRQIASVEADDRVKPRRIIVIQANPIPE